MRQGSARAAGLQVRPTCGATEMPFSLFDSSRRLAVALVAPQPFLRSAWVVRCFSAPLPRGAVGGVAARFVHWATPSRWHVYSCRPDVFAHAHVVSNTTIGVWPEDVASILRAKGGSLLAYHHEDPDHVRDVPEVNVEGVA